MFRFVPRIAAVLLLVVAGSLAPAAAEERPFSASGEGFVIRDNFYGEGQATHLGHSSLSMYGLFEGLLNDGTFYPFYGSLNSASGDVLNIGFDGEFHEFDPVTGVVIVTLTFTGGTGRLQDATGCADVMIYFDPYFSKFSFLMDGSIDY